jgi:two-component system sensor histidine kinase RegB
MPTPSTSILWLLRLRWCAVAGQSITVLAVHHLMRIDLPLGSLFGCIGITALSNLAAHVQARSQAAAPVWLAGALMATDVVVLTALLALTGGSGNPFASFYLVHATMSALVLSARGAWMIWALCSAGYGSLFLLRHICLRLGQNWCGPAMNYELHLHGMLVAFMLTGAAIAYFVGRILGVLREREHELAQARAREAQNERFAAVATLAAGAAHELGSPLGTIAIAAGELARQARALPEQQELAEDAELIREEVGRCRGILDRLQQTADDAPRSISLAEVEAELRAKLFAYSSRFNVCVEPGLSAVFAPPQGLVQSLAVLVKNSFDASGDGAPVTLEILRAGAQVGFTVRDRGAGLEDAARLHAGEPFFTTKPAGQGMGLGLFLVRLFAQRLGGRFELVSVREGGTAASLFLPQPA